MRPNRNRISRLVAAEMRYFHRPLILSLLSCFTIIISMLSMLFSLLSYVTSGSSDDARLYLDLSVALFILYVASYFIHRILHWGRSPSYSFAMSFTAVNFLFSAAASFLLTRAAWQNSLDNAVTGGFQIYVQNLLRWIFWAPGAVLLFYLICIFVKAKTANRGGGWLFLLFPLIPAFVLALLWLAMQYAVEKEDIIPITSIATAVYLSFMLVLAVRYAVKAILNRVLHHMRATEDTVLVRSTLRKRDGKWILWWEKKPSPIETIPDQLPLAESKPAAVEFETEPIPESAPIAAIDPAGTAKRKFHPAVPPEAELSKPVSKTKAPKEPKVRPPQSEKPRLDLRALVAAVLAAIRYPAISAPPPVPSELTEETAMITEASTVPERPQAPTEANMSEDSAIEISAAPDKARTPSKLKLLLNRVAAYLTKPYSPPIETKPAGRKKKKRIEQLSRLAAALGAVATKLQVSENAGAIDASPKSPSDALTDATEPQIPDDKAVAETSLEEEVLPSDALTDATEPQASEDKGATEASPEAPSDALPDTAQPQTPDDKDAADASTETPRPDSPAGAKHRKRKKKK